MVTKGGFTPFSGAKSGLSGLGVWTSEFDPWLADQPASVVQEYLDYQKAHPGDVVDVNSAMIPNPASTSSVVKMIAIGSLGLLALLSIAGRR